MHKSFLIIGALMGAVGVVLGAFGAHALKDVLSTSGRLDTYETAVKYQMYHSLALLLLGLLTFHVDHKFMQYAGWAFIIGTLIFSGSLYSLCATGITKLGAITPIGGVFLIAGWILMALGVYKASE
ncbi:MAG: uncharacterized membrane protein YgdD (TMEM256/DUF423 family) [Marivirga sp.]|jgi:uncharacterized membrane protein YgdD (TMEM256/DUF423 family)